MSSDTVIYSDQDNLPKAIFASIDKTKLETKKLELALIEENIQKASKEYSMYYQKECENIKKINPYPYGLQDFPNLTQKTGVLVPDGNGSKLIHPKLYAWKAEDKILHEEFYVNLKLRKAQLAVQYNIDENKVEKFGCGLKFYIEEVEEI